MPETPHWKANGTLRYWREENARAWDGPEFAIDTDLIILEELSPPQKAENNTIQTL